MTRSHHRIYHGRTAKSRNFGDALTHALRGLLVALILERNVRIQFLVLIAAVLLWWLLSLGNLQLIIILLASAATITMELINSSIEALADVVHPDYDERIQKTKDMAAAAVLVVSIASAAIGVGIFGPPLLALL